MSSSRKSSKHTSSSTSSATSAPTKRDAVVELIDRQDEPVPAAWLRRVARRALRQLRVTEGRFAIVLLDPAMMRQVNRRFLGHRGLTDVISFRYDGEAVVGEVLVSPLFAKRYAAAHGGSMRDELARYVVHGLLHWIGHDDKTPAQQRRMRRLEDDVLKVCATT